MHDLRFSFVRKLSKQLASSGVQFLHLVLFVVLFPRLIDNGESWLAQYFLYTSILSPVYMFASLESRKRTVLGSVEEAIELNTKRFTFSAIALILSALIALILHIFLFVPSMLFLCSLSLFFFFTSVNDQASANYERVQKFGSSLLSSLSKVVVFWFCLLISVQLFEPWIAVTIACVSMIIPIFILDLNAFGANSGLVSFGRVNFKQGDISAGLGAFVLSISQHGPRYASAAISENALLVLGVGQSVNKFGQLITASIFQTYISTRKGANRFLMASFFVMLGAGAIWVVLLYALLPIWLALFPSISDIKGINILLMWVFIFGVASQVNYALQSLILVNSGPDAFLRSAFLYLLVCTLGILVLFTTDNLLLPALLWLMVGVRGVQLAMNLRKLSCLKA